MSTAGALEGRWILVTREEGEEGPLGEALQRRGARVRRVRLLETHPPREPGKLRREAARLAAYDWVLFTSARAARALAQFVAPHDARPPCAAVGEATARCARELGWKVALVGGGGARELARTLAASSPPRCRSDRPGGQSPPRPLAGRCILYPAAEGARHEGVRLLREAGAEVCRITAYRTVARAEAAGELANALRAPSPEAIVFASPSAVEAFVRLAPADAPGEGVLRAALGPRTAAAIERAGLGPAVVPPEASFEALAEALARAFALRMPPGSAERPPARQEQAPNRNTPHPQEQERRSDA